MRICFDTSVLNKITNDPKSNEIVEKILGKFESYLSLLNCAEILANSNQYERVRIQKVADRLGRGYYPFAHPQEILRRCLNSYEISESTMNFSISQEDRGVWTALKSPEKVDDDARREALAWINREEDWYQNMHEVARPHIQAIISSQGQLKDSRSEFLRHFINNEILLKDIMTEFFKGTIFKDRFCGREIEIVSALEPWRFYLGAIGLGIYNRAVQQKEFSKKRHAGSIDTQQAVYMAAIDIFVTHDTAQRRMLKLVAKLGHIRREIWSYNKLLDSIGI